MVVGDDGEALRHGLVVERVEDDGAVAEVVEERAELGVEERQPVLHAGVPAALADGGVERVVVGRPEGVDVVLAEAADRIRGQLHLAHRHEVERAELPHRALRLGIEGADRFQRGAEEVEPHRERHAGGEEVDDAAPHGIFAGVAHHVRAQEPVGLEPGREVVGRDRIARRRRETVLGDAVARGTRCRMALTVVDRMRGLSAEERDRARRESTSIRRAAMAALGDTRS